jgi:uroporphyrinogen decarboxylase
MSRKPNFNNLLAVLGRQKPDRDTLFEFFLNNDLYEYFTGYKCDSINGGAFFSWIADAYGKAGYDFVAVQSSDFQFKTSDKQRSSTISLNNSIISDWVSFEKYTWNNPENYKNILKDIKLPGGMKMVVYSPGGVLENVISLIGFDNLCIMLYEEPELVETIFNEVGKRLLNYYENSVPEPNVGALIVNDDWGFNSQTMLSPEHMRKYVFPWHKRIVETIHNYNKPAILHSCGQLDAVFDDIIDLLKFDAKHSYEDKILPVEDAYEKYGSKIAILGGIDVDFVCRSTPIEIKQRSLKILEKTASRGGYALGTGNSVPYYVPKENYLAMISAVL